MRIFHVVHGFVPEAVGGVELQCHYLAAAMARQHDVAVLSWRSDPEKPDYGVEESEQDAVRVWRLNHRYTNLASFRGIYRDERIDDIFTGLLDRWQPDIVHVHHLIGLSTGILERTKQRGLPLVLGLHDYWFGCPRGQRIRHPLAICHDIDRRLCVPCLKPQNYELRAPRTPLWRWLLGARLPTFRRGLKILARYDDDMHHLLSLPDVLVTPAAFHRQMFESYGVDGRKVRIVPYGLPDLAPVARQDRSRLAIGFLGTLIPSKGVHVLLEAYGLLARPDVALDIYGPWVPFHGDTGYLDRLRATAATLEGDIKFHGRYEQGDLKRLLASLDVLVVPSVWYECNPIVIREAFLAGVPVVASGHGGMAESIEHDVTGLLFRPGDAADLARNLRRLVDDPALRRRLAQHPKQVSSIEENAARHFGIYGSLVQANA